MSRACLAITESLKQGATVYLATQCKAISCWQCSYYIVSAISPLLAGPGTSLQYDLSSFTALLSGRTIFSSGLLRIRSWILSSKQADRLICVSHVDLMPPWIFSVHRRLTFPWSLSDFHLVYICSVIQCPLVYCPFKILLFERHSVHHTIHI